MEGSWEQHGCHCWSHRPPRLGCKGYLRHQARGRGAPLVCRRGGVWVRTRDQDTVIIMLLHRARWFLFHSSSTASDTYQQNNLHKSDRPIYSANRFKLLISFTYRNSKQRCEVVFASTFQQYPPLLLWLSVSGTFMKYLGSDCCVVASHIKGTLTYLND